ncbi:hypothetical protein Peur_048556 [Populus x canadensis]
MELFMETYVRSQDRQKGAQQFIDNCAQHFVLTERYDHLSAEYAQLKASHAQQRAESTQQMMAYKQLREVVMNMVTQSGTCAPNPFWPYNHQPPPIGSPPPPPAPPLY